MADLKMNLAHANIVERRTAAAELRVLAAHYEHHATIHAIEKTEKEHDLAKAASARAQAAVIDAEVAIAEDTVAAASAEPEEAAA